MENMHKMRIEDYVREKILSAEKLQFLDKNSPGGKAEVFAV